MNAFMPISEVVLSSGLSLFAKVSALITGLIAVIYFMRTAYLVVKISPAQEYGKLIFDIVFYFGLIALFPILTKLIVFGIGDLAEKISYIAPEQAQNDLIDFADKLLSASPILMVTIKACFHFIQAIAFSVYTALISLFVAAAPVFIFMSTVLDINTGLKAFFGMLISLSLWPVLWNLLGQLAVTVSSQMPTSPISSVCFWLVIMTLQLLSPLFTLSLFKNLSPDIGTSKVMKMATLGKKVF